MSLSVLAKRYGRLTSEERFRLILAAGARGDESERDRLVRAGDRITLTFPDYAPYGQAFQELALLVFIELLDGAARYLAALARADDIARDSEADDGDDDDEGEKVPDESAETADPHTDGYDDNEEPSLEERSFRVALAFGFMLRTKADGWVRFCERTGVPPYALWEGLPGIDYLRSALALAEKAAFVAEGFLRWMNETRPAGRRS